MKYKKSFYNICISNEEENTLLYNSLSGAFIKLDSKCKEFYDTLELIDDNVIKSFNTENMKYFNLMIDNGIIVNYDLNEKEVFLTKDTICRYNSNTLTLTIAPTMQCNMACPYCYEKKDKVAMTQDTVYDIIQFIENNIKYKSYKRLFIMWYGGEPLLEKKIIYEISERVIEICKKNNIKFSASMVTNGTLLDEDTILKLQKYQVKDIQITLDGTSEVNNKRRLLKNGQGSFDIIFNNIKLAKDYIPITIRCNIDKTNQSEIPKVLELFNNENLLDNKNIYLYFAPVTNYTEACHATSCFTTDEFVEISKEIKDIQAKYNFIESIPPTCLSCGATGLHTYVIDSEGYLYRCWDDIEDHTKSIGTIKKGIEINNSFLKWFNYKIPKACTECKVLPICVGGCPYKRINKIEDRCTSKNIIIKQILNKYYSSYKGVVHD